MMYSAASTKRGVRPAAVAGRFYTANAEELRRSVGEMLEGAQLQAGRPKALIVPHAGYVYSGPIAASAFKQLQRAAGGVSRVVLVGPSHFVHFKGIAASSAEAFETPLGRVPVDTETVARLSSKSAVLVLDEAHQREHSLEVMLPFLQSMLQGFSIVPLVYGEVAYQQVAEVLEEVWGGPETLVVISSDLSHYLDSESAQELDKFTAEAIEALAPEGIGNEQACGRVGICALLVVGRKRGLETVTLDLRNSGDTAGPRDQVVGYGGFALYPPAV